MPGGRVEVEVVPDLRDFPGKLSSGLKGASGIASTLGKGLGVAIAAGTAVAAVGLKSVIDLGVEYTGNLNELQAVTSATGFQMSKVGEVAKALGADMSLPATSAADAASAMKELAKGGLDVNEAMTAAKGTLQLAAAAQIEAAQAAEIQSDALNQFGLSADQAGHVADVLANTANAASGEITDMANALKYIGPVARGLGVDIDNTAAAIGLLAVNGIRGEQAGTSLRGILASLASPSKEAAKAMDALGISAFDQAGKFVGLRTFTDQLAKAKGRLTDAEFAAAASTAFGNEGFTAANALALSGAAAFDDMAGSVSKAGGAAQVAAAKTQGLGGAWEGLKSQLETTGIKIFEAIDGPLERLVRAAAEQTAQIGEGVARGLEIAIAAGEVYGPRLADAIRSRASVVAQAGRDVLQPLAQGAMNPLNEALNTGIGLWDDFTGVLKNAVDGARPAAQGLGEVAKAAADGDGPVSALGTGLGLLGDAARIASGVLVPIGKLVGFLADSFAALPGPIQTAVVALGLVAAFRGKLADLGTTVRDKVTTPFVHFNETLRLQQALLTGSTGIASAQVGKLGLAFAALEARVPVIGRMADSYRNASTAAQGLVTNQSALVQTASGISGQYSGLATVLGRTEGALRGVAGVAAGTASAVGTGLKAAASGLVGALGGPFGIAIAAAGIGLSLLASRQEEAAQKAREHASRVDGLAAALRESNGQINESVRAHQAQAIQAAKVGEGEKSVADAAREAGISLSSLTDATLGNEKALEALRGKLTATAEANKEWVTLEDGSQAWTGRYNETGQAAADLLGSVDDLAKGFKDAQQRERDLDKAIREGRASMLDASDSGRTLSSAIGVLADRTSSADSKARALNDALIALSGGSVTLEAAQFRVAEVTSRLSDMFAANGSEAEKAAAQAKGFGNALLNSDGSLSSATENGRALRSVLQDLTTASADVAKKTYDMAIAQGASVPDATAKAVAAVQQSRDAFIGMAKDMGISAEQAEVLANRAGLIPANVAIVISTPGDDKTRQELAIIKGLVDAVPPGKDINMKTISAEAEAKLTDLGFKVTHMPDGTVVVSANTTPARQELDSYLREPATKVVTVVYTGGKSLGIGSAVNHDGNYLRAYASGGFNRLTPMSAGVASIVPPNTWRVIGDRMRDDEAYIPINSSWRSQQILARTASEMGYDLIKRFAVGGIATTGQASTAAPSIPGALSITGRLVVDASGFAQLVETRITSALDSAGSAITRRRRV